MIKEEEYRLTSQEIFGGIKSAVMRGESLKEAMMSFYRAGYNKNEIEEAAKVYLEMNKGEGPNVTKRIPEKEEKGEKINEGVEKKNAGIMPQTKKFQPLEKKEKKKENTQKVSRYGEVKKAPPAGKVITIILILVLALLIGILGAIVLFKSELVTFFNTLFG